MSDDSDSKVFCVLPWLHLCGSVDGVWGRCCVDSTIYYDDYYRQNTEPHFELNRDALGCAPGSRYAKSNPDRVLSAKDAFNSPNLRKTRLAMLEGEPVKACEYCYEREASGGRSYRQYINAHFAKTVDVAQLKLRTSSDGTVDSFPIYLDLRLGNACNLQCIMCSYPVSSRWGHAQRPTWATAHIDPYIDDETLWQQLREHAPELRRIYFAGGEPLMARGHERLVDLLIERNAASVVDLVYTTNLTLLPERMLGKWALFKSVEIGASCDGTGAVFERIRQGANWDTFVRNVRTAKAEFRVFLSVTPQRDNIFHLSEIVDFAVEEGIDVEFWNLLHWPAELAIRSLSPENLGLASAYVARLVDKCDALGLVSASRDLASLKAHIDSGHPPELISPQRLVR